jgi:hypothetical protein
MLICVSLEFASAAHAFSIYSGTIVKHACREGTQYLYAFNPNDIDEPGSALALAASTMTGITDDIISLPKIVKGMGYKCKLDGVDNGWEGLYKVDDKGNEYGHIPLVWDEQAGLWFIHFSVGKSELAAFKNRRHRACVFRKQLTWKDRNVDYQPSIETTGMPQAARFEQLRDKITSHYAKRNKKMRNKRRPPAHADGRIANFSKFKDKYKTEAEFKASETGSPPAGCMLLADLK